MSTEDVNVILPRLMVDLAKAAIIAYHVYRLGCPGSSRRWRSHEILET
jgi:hypothetical protein